MQKTSNLAQIPPRIVFSLLFDLVVECHVHHERLYAPLERQFAPLECLHGDEPKACDELVNREPGAPALVEVVAPVSRLGHEENDAQIARGDL